jgi:protocatechuate 3,4-dioxygenase alpha subunit
MTEQINPAPRLDNQDPSLFGQTPSQTVGPFFHYGLPWKGCADLSATPTSARAPSCSRKSTTCWLSPRAKGEVAGE